MILESSRAMLWLVSHMCSARADFELLELETTLWWTLLDIGIYFCKTQGSHSNRSIGKHMLYLHTMWWLWESISGSNKSRIITTNNCYGQQVCLDAWYSNVSSCALNRDDGSYLPQEYLHFVGRWRHLDSLYKVMSFNIRSPLMKTLDWSVEMLRWFHLFNKTCNKLDGTIWLVKRLFQQDWYSHIWYNNIVTVLCCQLCYNLVTIGPCQSC